MKIAPKVIRKKLNDFLIEQKGIPKHWTQFAAKIYWGHFEKNPGCGNTYEDIIHTSIERILSRKKNWKLKEDWNITTICFMTIRSVISNMVVKKKELSDAIISNKIDSLDNETENKLSVESKDDPDAPDILSSLHYKLLFEQCKTELENDNTLEIIFDEMKNDKTIGEIEKEYGTTKNEILAAQKKIKRILNRKFNKLYFK